MRPMGINLPEGEHGVGVMCHGLLSCVWLRPRWASELIMQGSVARVISW
jgi:hypothetical protein